jgi:hypothetical protein
MFNQQFPSVPAGNLPLPISSSTGTNMKNLVFVDCEATGPCPGLGELTEFGAVHYMSRETFHGVLFASQPSAENPAMSVIVGAGYDAVAVYAAFDEWIRSVVRGSPSLVSDNPAYDFQWINYGFHHTLGHNPFGHSARRISDFYAGLTGDWGNTQSWKRLRITKHDHNPVNDAMGNVEAFARIMNGER